MRISSGAFGFFQQRPGTWQEEDRGGWRRESHEIGRKNKKAVKIAKAQGSVYLLGDEINARSS